MPAVKQMDTHANKRRIYQQLAAASLVLLLGVFVYILDRNPQRVYFLTGVLNHSLAKGTVFGVLGSSLPSFTHVYAFILFTAALLPPGRKTCLGATLFWLITDSAFEIAQHSALAPSVASAVPAWFAGIPVLDNTRAYFLHSTFDPIDLAAIVIGAVTAAVTILFTLKHNAPPTASKTNVNHRTIDSLFPENQ